MKKTVMETLSRELSETEREAMFRKIRQDIIQTESDAETIELKEENSAERLKLIKADMSRAGIWERLVVWFRSYLTGKKKEDIFASRKLISLKRQISRRAPGITGFETRNLTPKIAESVYDIYKSAIILKKSFSDLWIAEGHYEKVIVYLLLNRIKHNKGRLEDFITMEEMVEIYGIKGQKEDVRNEILKRLQDYSDSIPEEAFNSAEQEIEPFYFLKETVLFPYVAFFQLFGFNPAAMPDVKKPFFHNASAMLALNFLEKLYVSGVHDSFIREPIVIQPGTIKTLLNLSDPEDDPFSEIPDNKSPGAANKISIGTSKPAADVSANSEAPEYDVPEIIREEKLKNYINDLNELHKKVQRFNRNIPILDIIRFFHKDPYYNIKHKITGLHFNDFYYMIIKNSVLNNFNQVFVEVKQQYIQLQIDEMFAGKSVFVLQNYRKYTSIDYDKMGLPFFRHTRSINLLFNYIKAFYRSYFYDAFQLLDKNILVNNRIIKDKLEATTNTFEEIGQKILEFDYSMSPDSEDGKLFQRLRFSMASESSHQKMFRTLVLQKDREVKGLLEKGDEDLASLIKLLGDIIDSPAQSIKLQLKTHYIFKSKSIMLGTLLETRRAHLLKFRDLLGQITKEERG
ncbi:MAG: hypothetical protein JEY99_16925 [Spirochaetales bacterium]|nr:hypothetical protein [Spirochaetales bacterium]